MNDEKSKELGIFLRTRRERIMPEQYNLKSYAKRRTKGLKREEVAVLSGVSLSWYTWLEQGRDIHVSSQVLEAVSRTLCLNEEEKQYVFELAETKSPTVPNKKDTESLVSLQKILDSLKAYPAYIVDEYWNNVAWNTAACALFGDFEKMDELEKNVLWRMFTNQSYRVIFKNWEELAQRLLAQFRMDYSKNINRDWYNRLVKLLNQSSSEFKKWWPDYDICGGHDGIKEVVHPEIGSFSLRHNNLHSVDSSGLTVVIYTPVSESDRIKMQAVIDLYTSQNN
ncbi:MAG: helix-turn-helix transcriptional regulator [Bacillota bacterium]|nr:helix-turn-helix transcriptional regulator [Bacillota bacterium]